jgi:hypothetical protein
MPPDREPEGDSHTSAAMAFWLARVISTPEAPAVARRLRVAPVPLKGATLLSG